MSLLTKNSSFFYVYSIVKSSKIHLYYLLLVVIKIASQPIIFFINSRVSDFLPFIMRKPHVFCGVFVFLCFLHLLPHKTKPPGSPGETFAESTNSLSEREQDTPWPEFGRSTPERSAKRHEKSSRFLMTPRGAQVSCFLSL